MSVAAAVQAIRAPHYKAHTTIKINCGCGFRTSSINEAEQHALQNGHTLHVAGEVTRTT